jgi:hypothetical protein
MLCKPEQEKFTKRVKPTTEEHRKRQARKREERERHILNRKRSKSFDKWSMFIREGVRPCDV